jgi:hypothetical protein
MSYTVVFRRFPYTLLAIIGETMNLGNGGAPDNVCSRGIVEQAINRETIVNGKLRNIVVKRSEWYRGHSAVGCTIHPNNPAEDVTVYSALRVKLKDGAVLGHCCLGFAAMQCGVPAKELENRNMPLNIPREIRPKALDVFIGYDNFDGGFTDSDLAKEAAKLNDDSEMTDETREAELTKLFAEHGIDIHFVD